MEAVRPRSGAFAEYSSVHGDMVFKLPEGMSFAVGAGMPLRIATAALALFHSLGLPSELLDEKQTKGGESFDVLVYGGATSTGTMAIQLLKICGLRVITTCSPKNFELVRGYGADECVDYHSPTCGPDIRAMTKNELDYALDCVTNEGTMKICYQALGRCGGKCRTSSFLPDEIQPVSFNAPISNCSIATYGTDNPHLDVALEPYPDTATTRQAVRPDWILVTWMRGLPISWPAPFGTETAKPGYQAFGREVMPKLHRLFEEGKLSSHPIREEKDGFEGLLDGVDLLRKGKVRGEKLVYRTQERRCVVSAAA